MRSKSGITFSSILFLFLLIQQISALSIQYINEDAKIPELYQKCAIIGDSTLSCNTLLSIFIQNKTKPYIEIDIYEGYLGDTTFDSNSITLCNFFSSVQNGDIWNYYSYNITKENCYYKNLPIQKEIVNGKGADLRIKINQSFLNEAAYYLYFNYSTKNFIQLDPIYKTIFFNTYLPKNATISRTIILPKNSVIDAASLYKFKILAIVGENQRVLLTESLGQSIALYQDWDKEQLKRNGRDWTIITLSLGLSIIIQIYFSSRKMSLRSKNLWMFSGLSLVVTTILLFFDRGSDLPGLLIISYILFFIFSILALLSSAKDDSQQSIKRELKQIVKFIKSLFNN